MMVPLGPSPYVDVQFGGTKGDATDSPGKFPVTSLENLVGPPHKPPGKFRADKTKNRHFSNFHKVMVWSKPSPLYEIRNVVFV